MIESHIMEIKEVKAELFRLCDKSGHLADFSKSLNLQAGEIIGVRIPDLRTLAKKIAKDDYKKFLDENPLDFFEMEMLHGLVIGYAKADLSEIFSYSADFIPKIHDWAVNDTFCQTFSAAKKEQKATWEFLSSYFKSKNEFESRVVAVMILSHFLNDTFIDKSISVLDGLYSGETSSKTDSYYAKMGIAWAVATIAAKYPTKCLEYMTSTENHLDNWTFNKSIQKMNESYRVDSELKKRMKSLIRPQNY